MSYSLTDLVSALGGGKSFREKLLPESKDFASWLTSSPSPSQTAIMGGLIDYTKDALLTKALTDRALLAGKLYG